MATVRYIVDDVKAAIEFYTRHLNFQVEMHPAPGFALLAREDLRLMLNTPGAGGAGQAMPDGQMPKAGGWNRIQILVDDLASTYERLKTEGATFRNEIVQGNGGKQVLLQDPSGNLIELLEPKKPPSEKIKPVFRGIFLTSEKPEHTANFYKDVVGLELEQVGKAGEYVYWKIDKDGVQIAIHDAGAFAGYTFPAFAQSNVTHLYFKIANQEQFLQHLGEKNVEPYARDDVVITVTDPDGRRVMFGTA
jgi:predicted enzyme related to lactoylglutathione lyase